MTVNNSNQYILIIEDSPVDYEIAVRSLKKAGISNPVYHYKNGDDALAFLHGEADSLEDRGGFPGLILLDLNLPGTDGRQVLEDIKSHEDTKKIPVIVLSTSDQHADIESCYRKGANSYIPKPTRPDEYFGLAKAIKEYWFHWARQPDDGL